MNFYGYVRKDGKVGARNYIAVIPMVFCVNEVVEAIVSNTMNTKSLCHHQGCCQLPPDLERVTKCLIGLGKNPNVAARFIGESWVRGNRFGACVFGDCG